MAARGSVAAKLAAQYRLQPPFWRAKIVSSLSLNLSAIVLELSTVLHFFAFHVTLKSILNSHPPVLYNHFHGLLGFS